MSDITEKNVNEVTENEQKAPSYYAIIPANVRYDNRLKFGERLLYGEITALANKKGYCWAGDTYFANLYETSRETINRWIKHLHELGYISVKQNTSRRLIYIGCDEKITPLVTKRSQTCDEKITHNININITENKKENNQEPFSFFSENQEEEIPKPENDDPPSDEPAKSKEDAIRVFNKARKLSNELKIFPECRDLIIPPAKYDCLTTFQNYSWVEIENALLNFHWHNTGQCGPGWKPPPGYQTLYGFLINDGVVKYANDEMVKRNFREGKNAR